MKFWDREKEKEWMKRYIQTEPNAILFVYGPKSSGKTTLLMKVVEELPKDSFVYYWYDLREKVITGYESVIDLFFKEKGWLRSFIEAVSPKINIGVFELEPERVEGISKKKLDAFEEMRKELEKVRKTGKVPVIIFDEIQKLKEIYMNGDEKQRPLVRELFNFFVRITKVLHLAHVIVMTSDTFFIERVYVDSALKNTAEYYLVDYFDDNTARRILLSEGIPEEDVKFAVEWIGGVPWIMERIMSSQNIQQKIEELYNQTLTRIIEITRGRKDLREIFKRILEGENLYYRDEGIEKIKELVEREILFMDPVKMKIKFQTKLDERAAREVTG